MKESSLAIPLHFEEEQLEETHKKKEKDAEKLLSHGLIIRDLHFFNFTFRSTITKLFFALPLAWNWRIGIIRIERNAIRQAEKNSIKDRIEASLQRVKKYKKDTWLGLIFILIILFQLLDIPISLLTLMNTVLQLSKIPYQISIPPPYLIPVFISVYVIESWYFYKTIIQEFYDIPS